MEKELARLASTALPPPLKATSDPFYSLGVQLARAEDLIEK
jgi:hypothetical protein